MGINVCIPGIIEAGFQQTKCQRRIGNQPGAQGGERLDPAESGPKEWHHRGKPAKLHSTDEVISVSPLALGETKMKTGSSENSLLQPSVTSYWGLDWNVKTKDAQAKNVI